jgi:ectoine hydroxylase-related dioxygenase (phytanoyl-CoA dioxygenase family)
MGMNDQEKFLFDLQGFLVLEDVLSQQEVADASAAIDHHDHLIAARPPGLAHTSARLKGELGKEGLRENPLGFDRPWCEPFRRMLTHPRVVDIFNEVLGPGFRLDHGPMLIQMHRGTEGHWLHGGMTFDPCRYHRVEHGLIHCGLCVAAWQLTDVGPGDGGFACVPGSHKSAFRPPTSLVSTEDDSGLIHQPVLKSGSLLVFNEALLHGTLPWQPADRLRRSILFKYSPGFLSWARPPGELPMADPTPEELVLYDGPRRTGRASLGQARDDRQVTHAF